MTPTTNPSVPLTYDEKIAKAYECIPAQIKEKLGYEKPEDFAKDITGMGGTDDDALRLASYEDLQGIGIPLLTAKKIAEIFRGPAKAAEQPDPLLQRPVGEWKSADLVRRMDPLRPFDPVTAELHRRVRGQTVVAFGPDGRMDEAATQKLVGVVEEGLAAPAFAEVGGRVVPTYAPGYGPHRIKDCCPAHPAQPLIDGRCIACQRNWEKIARDAKLMAFYAVRAGLVKADDREAVGRLHDLAMQGADKVADTYPEARAAYDKDMALGQLPGLRVDVGGPDDQSTGGSPFGKNRRS